MATLIELDGVAPTLGEDVDLVPAHEKKELSGSALDWTRGATDGYQRYSIRYMTAGRVLEDTSRSTMKERPVA